MYAFYSISPDSQIYIAVNDLLFNILEFCKISIFSAYEFHVIDNTLISQDDFLSSEQRKFTNEHHNDAFRVVVSNNE